MTEEARRDPDGPGDPAGRPDPACPFCQIVAGELPSRRLGETDRSVAFADVDPKAPLHALVVPRVHRRDAAALGTADGELLADLVALANRCAAEQGVAAGGYRLVLNVGDDAGNSVPHLHLHLLGGRRLGWPPG